MAGIRFSRLVDSFASTLERLSATVIRAKAKDDVRPASVRVVTGDGRTDCLLLLWTVTRGGGASNVRPENERRIQLTGVTEIPLRPGIRTLLGGWSDEYGVYAFWDSRRHTRYSRNSPSLQVTSETLETAGSVGIATYFRPSEMGSEVVVAVHPDSLLWYVQHGLSLHNSDRDSEGVQSLVDASHEDEEDFLSNYDDESQAARRYDLVETMRAYREAKFRPAVLRAYGYQCAICRCALKLVDAAHIVPVSYPESTDEVTNGLALCRLHHGAYDNGLLGVQANYRIITNPNREQALSELQLDMGLDEFRNRLPETIHVPGVIEARPIPDNLRRGLEARQWPPGLVA